jgi:hypothetical protein
MLDEMSPEQFHEWMAFYRIEPFGDAWEHTDTICAVVDSGNGIKPRRYRPFMEHEQTEDVGTQFDRMAAGIRKYGNTGNTRR